LTRFFKRKRSSKGRGAKKGIHLSAEEKSFATFCQEGSLRAHVHKMTNAALLRLVDEFKIRITVEHAGDVHQPEIFRELKKRNIPVTYGPLDGFAYKVELKHESWRNIRYLLDSKVQFGLMTDHPVTPARQIFLQTRWFMRAGASKQEAVDIVSRRNAEGSWDNNILGTLEKEMGVLSCWTMIR
jgi:imidazolonepropionase-like amidohydrolase